MKNQNFVVEVIKDDDNKIFVIRDLQGRVIKVCADADGLATFFNELKFEA